MQTSPHRIGGTHGCPQTNIRPLRIHCVSTEGDEQVVPRHPEGEYEIRLRGMPRGKVVYLGRFRTIFPPPPIITHPLDVWIKKTRNEKRGFGGKSLILERIPTLSHTHKKMAWSIGKMWALLSLLKIMLFCSSYLLSNIFIYTLFRCLRHTPRVSSVGKSSTQEPPVCWPLLMSIHGN